MPSAYRIGTLEDAPIVYEVFVRAIANLERRARVAEADNMWMDPAAVAEYWERKRPLFEHLARTAEQFRIAECNGQVIGYARATLCDGVRQLTDFFVLPAHQAEGVGRELLGRVFPVTGARRRAVIATRDVRALARYLKAGVSSRFPIYFFSGQPRPVAVASDLTFVPAASAAETLAAMRADTAVLGFTRDATHEFLLRDRRAYLYRRGERVVGYGYFGNGTGPIALLEPADFPAVLAQGETEAAERDETSFGMNVPLVNRAVVDYLLGRGFQLEDFTMFAMSDEPFGAFERYVISSPAFFL